MQKYLPVMTQRVRELEDHIEQEIRTNHEVSAASDELLSIKRGILRILRDYDDQFQAIIKQRPQAQQTAVPPAGSFTSPLS